MTDSQLKIGMGFFFFFRLQHFSDDGLCVPGAAALGENKRTLGRSLKVSTGEVFCSSAAKP